jgi:hypothetical protein
MDNITAPASGTVFATKDLGNVHFPKNLIVDQTGADAIGAVADEPSEWSVLGRLKTIAESVTGAAYYPTTQPISAASLPLPSGAATSAKQDVAITALQNSAPADDLFAITPGASALSTVPKALLVTAAGTLSIGGTSNTPVSLGTVAVGQIIPVRARYVYSAGTTATVVGLV